jgi:hypothetical protein
MEAIGEQGKSIKGQNMTIMACNDILNVMQVSMASFW